MDVCIYLVFKICYYLLYIIYIQRPDTYVDSIAEKTGFLLPQKGSLFVIQSNGEVFWSNPLSKFKVRCKIDIKWFPYDEQICQITFGSWSYTSDIINYTSMHDDSLHSDPIGTDNLEWILKSYKAKRFEIKYDHWFDAKGFTEIKYTILIKRKSLFFIQNYCTPAILLCTIILISFFIPFPQQTLIGINVLLSFAVIKLK